MSNSIPYLSFAVSVTWRFRLVRMFFDLGCFLLPWRFNTLSFTMQQDVGEASFFALVFRFIYDVLVIISGMACRAIRK